MEVLKEKLFATLYFIPLKKIIFCSGEDLLHFRSHLSEIPIDRISRNPRIIVNMFRFDSLKRIPWEPFSHAKPSREHIWKKVHSAWVKGFTSR